MHIARHIHIQVLPQPAAKIPKSKKRKEKEDPLSYYYKVKKSKEEKKMKKPIRLSLKYTIQCSDALLM